MKTRVRPLLPLLYAATAALLNFAPAAQAGYIVTLTQQGSNVVAIGSGALDLTGLNFDFTGSGALAVIGPSSAQIITGPTSGSADLYIGIISGPTSFGSGGNTFASSGSGDVVGKVEGSADLDLLIVPTGYVSGNALSDSSTYNNATFASLGITPGTYEWTWGTGPNQNFTLKIGTAVPDGESSLMLLGIVILCLLVFRLVHSRMLRV